ncbi:hypothetical protein [Saccharococcus caldoxylosilyticus]|uniref:LXG domain-containing protein n=1 Tax=Saccharococcus caldoxylosilyticus TaxID=81408 RepID=A0A150LJC6_9BACL|nr:hypothetical protein [Parageobacillus caldoxylosilyticus]KYD12428.1 hypothetical protein B4119_2934 [Parageobacillus caldoxylosilyticus]
MNDVNDVLKFLVEKVIPLMVSKLDFNKEELKVEVNANAFFTNYRGAGKEFATAYNNALEELETQCKQRLDILTAKYTAIRDIVRQVEFRNSNHEDSNHEALEYLKKKQDEVAKELAEITNEYKVIQSAKFYVSNALNSELYRAY